MMRPFSLIGIIVGSIMIGAGVVAIHDQAPSLLAAPHYPMTLSGAQKAATNLIVQMPAVSAHIEVMTQQDFDAWRKSRSLGPGTTGAQFWKDGECAIAVPSYQITVTPRLGRASFISAEDAETVAHELFHCAAGEWHPDWSTIRATETAEATKKVREFLTALKPQDSSEEPLVIVSNTDGVRLGRKAALVAPGKPCPSGYHKFTSVDIDPLHATVCETD